MGFPKNYKFPRRATGQLFNEIVRFEIVGGFIVKPKNNITLGKKTKNLHKKNMNECTPTQYGVKQPSVEAANRYTRKIVSLPFSISEKFELPGLSSRPNHTHFPPGMGQDDPGDPGDLSNNLYLTHKEYLRGSAFGSAAEPKVGWFSTPTKKNSTIFPHFPIL